MCFVCATRPFKDAKWQIWARHASQSLSKNNLSSKMSKNWFKASHVGGAVGNHKTSQNKETYWEVKVIKSNAGLRLQRAPHAFMFCCNNLLVKWLFFGLVIPMISAPSNQSQNWGLCAIRTQYWEICPILSSIWIPPGCVEGFLLTDSSINFCLWQSITKWSHTQAAHNSNLQS